MVCTVLAGGHVLGFGWACCASSAQADTIRHDTVQNCVFHDASTCNASLDKVGWPIKYELPNQATI